MLASSQPADQQSARSTDPASGCSDSRSRSRQTSGRPVPHSHLFASLLSRPTLDASIAASFFSKRLLQQLVLHAELCKHLLQTTVIVLYDLHLRDHRRVQAAVLRSPLVKCCTADCMLAAHLSQGQSALNLAQDAHDPGFRKSALPRQNLLILHSEKIRPSMTLSLGEDYLLTSE
jgi:hypothetical protein